MDAQHRLHRVAVYGAADIATDQAGDVIVTGRMSNNRNTGNPDYYLYTSKHAGSDGHLLWQYTASSRAIAQDIARIVRVDGAKNVIVAIRTATP